MNDSYGLHNVALGAGIPQSQWTESQVKAMQQMQAQEYQRLVNQAAPPAPPMGVLAMTDNAHEAFQRLSNALGELRDRLNPLTEPYPETGEKSCTANQIAEASAVVGLRVLVERIDTKTAEIHRLLSALRV